MKEFSRSGFLMSLISAAAAKTAFAEDDSQSVKESNPILNKARTHGIMHYSGHWGQPQLLHLLRRTLFGVTHADYHRFSGLNLSQSLDILLTQTPTPSPPVNSYNDAEYTDPDVPFGQTWVHGTFGNIDGNADREE